MVVDRTQIHLTEEASVAFEQIHDQWELTVCEKYPHDPLVGGKGLLLGVEDTGHVTIEHCLANLLFLLYSSFFCPFVLFCYR